MLCKDDFLNRIEVVAQSHPKGIILREKTLAENEYEELAKQVVEICEKYNTPCILHSYADVAKKLCCKAIHMPLHILRTFSERNISEFETIGTSCHSLEEAEEAERLGCTYIVAGHIFETDCKKGLQGRGLDFLSNICERVDVPIYAIGGINNKNIVEVRKAGAAGACVMSGIMTCGNPKEYLAEFKE